MIAQNFKIEELHLEDSINNKENNVYMIIWNWNTTYIDANAWIQLAGVKRQH